MFGTPYWATGTSERAGAAAVHRVAGMAHANSGGACFIASRLGLALARRTAPRRHRAEADEAISSLQIPPGVGRVDNKVEPPLLM